MKKSISLVLSIALLCGGVGLGTANAAEERYAATYGGIIDAYIDENVYYASRDITDVFINQYELPLYYASGIANSCAITAGGAIIGNFDRTYEELIPNHSAFLFMGLYTYKGQDDEVDAMHQELYERMGSTSEGTTIVGYKSGMISYVHSKGRTIEIGKIYSQSKLDQAAYTAALRAGKLLTVFLDGFAVVSRTGVNTKEEGYDVISQTIVKGLHTVAAYGYRNVRYYDASNNLIQEDNYLYVHTGLSTGGLAMIRLNKYTTVDDGYVINIT